MGKRVLFFLNNLNRTGSETLLFNFIQELHKTQKISIGIVLMEKGGELVPEIPSTIPVFYLDFHFKWLDKIAFHLGKDIIGQQLEKIQKQFKADSWYLNTLAHLGLLRYKKQFSIHTYVHIHELLYNFESLKADEFDLLKNECDHLIACSGLVEDLFKPYFKNKITIINSTVNQKELVDVVNRNKSNPSKGKLKIVSSGTICYRKGTDLFLEVAQLLSKETYEFIWLGKFANNAYSEIIKLKNAQTNSVQFLQTNTQKEYLEILAQADLFLSTSREESMGLVMQEAVTFHIPIVALNSGGASLIVNSQNGVICYDHRPEEIVKAIEKIKLEKKGQSILPFQYQQEIEKFVSLFN
ncbi:MAG: D-inositol-3-phosphate glycosyltransferase [Bacteroidota bacterium]|jgi:glycosyltransferase involved in cell wall biosynthesis